MERTGRIQQMRFDNGSNFVGAVKELRKSVQCMSRSKINEYLQMDGVDWITWITNTASHVGGVLEKQIRTSRGTVNALNKTHEKRLDNKSLHTLFVEVEAVVN